jgi:hypothetical protein
MKKIPCIFEIDYSDRSNPKVMGWKETCLWVQKGEGVATRKFDGTAVLFKDGWLWRRYDAKHGKIPPIGFVPAQDPDPITRHYPGWIPLEAKNPSDKYFFEASIKETLVDGQTYELCGPKVQGNPEKFDTHVLIKHGSEILEDFPRDLEGMKLVLSKLDIEGVVFHRGNGEMGKITKKHLGLKR